MLPISSANMLLAFRMPSPKPNCLAKTTAAINRAITTATRLSTRFNKVDFPWFVGRGNGLDCVSAMEAPPRLLPVVTNRER